MDILDIYDKDGHKLNRTRLRGSPHWTKDEYSLAVDVWIKNEYEEILLTQRDPKKKYYPTKWECTCGIILTGEDSINGALREVVEEIGIRLNKDEGKKISRIIRHNLNMIFDIFLFIKNIDINEIRLQEGEVIDAKWVKKDELRNMFINNEMVELLSYVGELIDDGIM